MAGAWIRPVLRAFTQAETLTGIDYTVEVIQMGVSGDPFPFRWEGVYFSNFRTGPQSIYKSFTPGALVDVATGSDWIGGLGFYTTVSNDWFKRKVVTGIASSGATSVVTSAAHALPVGTKVYLSHVEGMTQINYVVGTIVAVAANTFTLDIDSSAFSVFSLGAPNHANAHWGWDGVESLDPALSPLQAHFFEAIDQNDDDGMGCPTHTREDLSDEPGEGYLIRLRALRDGNVVSPAGDLFRNRNNVFVPLTGNYAKWLFSMEWRGAWRDMARYYQLAAHSGAQALDSSQPVSIVPERHPLMTENPTEVRFSDLRVYDSLTTRWHELHEWQIQQLNGAAADHGWAVTTPGKLTDYSGTTGYTQVGDFLLGGLSGYQGTAGQVLTFAGVKTKASTYVGDAWEGSGGFPYVHQARRGAAALDSGTATGGSTTQLADTLATWVADEHIDRILIVRPGAGDEEVRLITDNAVTTLTFSALTTLVSAGDAYEIWPVYGFWVLCPEAAEGVEVTYTAPIAGSYFFDGAFARAFPGAGGGGVNVAVMKGATVLHSGFIDSDLPDVTDATSIFAGPSSAFDLQNVALPTGGTITFSVECAGAFSQVETALRVGVSYVEAPVAGAPNLVRPPFRSGGFGSRTIRRRRR